MAHPHDDVMSESIAIAGRNDYTKPGTELRQILPNKETILIGRLPVQVHFCRVFHDPHDLSSRIPRCSASQYRLFR